MILTSFESSRRTASAGGSSGRRSRTSAEVVVDHGDVRLLQAGLGEDVDDAAAGHVLADDWFRGVNSS